jgi:hypothetical protein
MVGARTGPSASTLKPLTVTPESINDCTIFHCFATFFEVSALDAPYAIRLRVFTSFLSKSWVQGLLEFWETLKALT